MTSQGHRVAVLIVEDSPTTLERIQKDLLAEIDEVQVIATASDARDAISALELRPDIVLLDLHLASGTSGFDVLQRMKRIHHPAQVIVITNDPNPLFQAAAERMDVQFFLDKAQASEIERAVRQIAAELKPHDGIQTTPTCS